MSGKINNLLLREKKPIIKRKGHLLLKPTNEQIDAIYKSILSTARIAKVPIYDTTGLYPVEEPGWLKRPIDIIDEIIISATNNVSVDASKLYIIDTSENNDVTPGKKLPGIACHLFINSNGIIEKVSDFENVVWHTKGHNLRSICVMLQYYYANGMPPTTKLINALERVLTILCMQFKLNPYKAIKLQKDAFMKFLPFTKGRNKIGRTAPGEAIFINELRKAVAISIQRKLRYSQLYNGPIKSKFTLDIKDALNNFNSNAFKILYQSIIDDSNETQIISINDEEEYE